MKRFYKDVAVEPVEGGFRVTLDGRGIKTPKGAPQLVPSRALAEAMAAEWASQGDEIEASRLIFRDLADYAIDIAAAEGVELLRFAETDTLCYRAEPDEPLYARQQDLWEPILTALEAKHGIRFERISGIVHRPQPPETMAALGALLDTQDPFALAALNTMASLAASLAVALSALEDGADPEALYAAANAEEDWQAEQWGWEWTAEELRAKKLAEFKARSSLEGWRGVRLRARITLAGHPRLAHPELVEGSGAASRTPSCRLRDNSCKRSQLPSISASFFALLQPLIPRSALKASSRVGKGSHHTSSTGLRRAV